LAKEILKHYSDLFHRLFALFPTSHAVVVLERTTNLLEKTEPAFYRPNIEGPLRHFEKIGGSRFCPFSVINNK